MAAHTPVYDRVGTDLDIGSGRTFCRMRRSTPKGIPQTQAQAVLAGGPPKPPVKTANGLNGSPDGPEIELRDPTPVRELALLLSLKPFQIIGTLQVLNVFASMDDQVTFGIAVRVCSKYGISVRKV